jgi:hypothetical protein
MVIFVVLGYIGLFGYMGIDVLVFVEELCYGYSAEVGGGYIDTFLGFEGIGEGDELFHSVVGYPEFEDIGTAFDGASTASFPCFLVLFHPFPLSFLWRSERTTQSLHAWATSWVV